MLPIEWIIGRVAEIILWNDWYDTCFHYSDILKVLPAKLGEEIGKGLFILDISFCISDKKACIMVSGLILRLFLDFGWCFAEIAFEGAAENAKAWKPESSLTSVTVYWPDCRSLRAWFIRTVLIKSDGDWSVNVFIFLYRSEELTFMAAANSSFPNSLLEMFSLMMLIARLTNGSLGLLWGTGSSSRMPGSACAILSCMSAWTASAISLSLVLFRFKRFE